MVFSVPKQIPEMVLPNKPRPLLSSIFRIIFTALCKPRLLLQLIRIVSDVELPCIVFFFLVSLGGVRLSPLGTSANVGLLYQPRMIDDDDYGAVGEMRIGRENRSTRRKPATVPLCPTYDVEIDVSW
jgi:hypothetical protein